MVFCRKCGFALSAISSHRRIRDQTAGFDPLLTFGPAHEIETHAPPDFPQFIKLYDFWEGLRSELNYKV
jgi:hypothetical protein